MGDKKNNLVSLSAYRGKKKKLKSKKSRKVASDADSLVTDGEVFSDDKTSKDLTENQSAKIYYMDNYIKTKTRKRENREQVQKNVFQQKVESNAKILILADYRKKQQSHNQVSRKINQGSDPISLEDYRNKKQKKLAGIKPLSYGAGAMVLTLLLVFSVFFQKQQVDPVSRGLAQVEEKTPRGLAEVEKKNSVDWKQKMRETDFTKEKYLIGKKPDSSEYKGF